MLCQNCGRNEATTHIKQIVNGEITESCLCAACAERLGYTDAFSGFGFNLSELFGGFLGDATSSLALGASRRCPKCGTSFNEIVRDGIVGCADCYRTFYDALLPTIHRIHGKSAHAGKISAAYPSARRKETKEEKIEKLKAKMDEAVAEQDFENAAKIRDEIKELEKGEDK